MDANKLGKKIKLARIELDLTQTQLAQKINSKQKSISHYETGASLPSIETLVKIAQALKKPASYFLDERIRCVSKFFQNGNNKKLYFEASTKSYA